MLLSLLNTFTPILIYGGPTLYKGTQTFISQLNLIQHEMILLLFMWASYHNSTTIHGNIAISYLQPFMPRYGKGEESTSIYNTSRLIWCCHASIFYALLHFQCFLHFYPIIQISFLQSIPHFNMKHNTYFSTLLEPSYLAMILF